MLATIAAYTLIYMSALGFLLTVTDRILAKTTKIRIHENILIGVACLFGAIGVTLGFFLAKRGLYKPEVRLGVPAIALGETVLLFWAIPGFFAALQLALGIGG